MRLFSGLLPALSLAGSAAEWKSRTIYQLLTDRFAVAHAKTGAVCSNLDSYCGGSFAGIESKLDYLAGMGFDAIWISPVVDNTDNGYHGYWARNWQKINENFGSEQELRSLVEAAHKRGIWVMLDVVANHVGMGAPGDDFVPFTDSANYHDCNGCPGSCGIEDWNNAGQVEHCRLAGLPDLNQDDADTAKLLKSWVRDMVSNFGFDGIRVDTVPEVKPQFWGDYRRAAGVYSVGEVFNGDANYVSEFQAKSADGPGLDGTLGYPLYYAIHNAFSGQSMRQLRSTLENCDNVFADVELLGNFVDNHDNDRFLHQINDQAKLRSALTYVLFARGIPIVYYGTEALLNGGGSDGERRQPLWGVSGAYDTKSQMYQYFAAANGARKQAQVWSHEQVNVWEDDESVIFNRGSAMVCMTNVGQNGGDVQRTVTHPWEQGAKACNVLASNDCLEISGNSVVITMQHGEPKIYVPVTSRAIVV